MDSLSIPVCSAHDEIHVPDRFIDQSTRAEIIHDAAVAMPQPEIVQDAAKNLPEPFPDPRGLPPRVKRGVADTKTPRGEPKLEDFSMFGP
jgi:hypothetical protein